MIRERMRRTRLLRRAREYDDHLVQDYVRLLCRENRELRADVYGRRGFSPGGRYVFGRVVMLLLLGSLVMAALIWWNSSNGASAYRKSQAEGRAASTLAG